MHAGSWIVCLVALITLSGCNNNPYVPGETAKSIYYTGLGDDPKSLDPGVCYDIGCGAIIDPIYPAFFKYHYLKREPFVLVPCLGAEEPRREKQGSGERWTFRIKKGLRFQDDPCFPGGKGREITAADFIYSFKRMADPSLSCPITPFFEGKIIGMLAYEEHNKARNKNKLPSDLSYPIEGLQVDPQDPYTFHITLNTPYPQLRYLMALHFTSPLAHEAVTTYGKELARHPVGCGAYLLSEYKPKTGIILKANPNRMEETYPSEGAPGDAEAGLLHDAGKRLPLAAEVHFSIIREGVSAWNLFLQGYLDVAGVSQQNFQQVMGTQGALSPEMLQKGIRLQRDTGTDVSYFAFGMNDPVFGGYTPKKRKLRQAISLAIDSKRLIELTSMGMGKPAQSVLPPSLLGYDPNYQNPYRQHDLEKAKRLLAEAGYPGGIDPQTGERLTLIYTNPYNTPAGRQLLGLITRMIEEIGIHVDVRSFRFGVFQEKKAKGEFQFMDYSWYADYPDPENFAFLFYSPNKPPGPNSTQYHNPEYDRLFEQMSAMEDGPERVTILEKMRAIVVEDCPWIYHQHSETFFLTHDWVHNIKPHPVAYDTLKYYRVEGEQRARQQRSWNAPNYGPTIGLTLFLILGSLPAAGVIRRRSRRRVRKDASPEVML